MKKYNIELPFKQEDIKKVRAGDLLYLTGTVYTARDAAHKRLVENLENLPIDIENQVIYYVGPTPKFGNLPIGSAGPTTSARMDRFTPQLMQHGLKATIGKGDRDISVLNSCIENQGLYLVTTGGVGALLSKCITKCEEIVYQDLGPESIKKLEIVDFPVYVGYDVYGNDIYNM